MVTQCDAERTVSSLLLNYVRTARTERELFQDSCPNDGVFRLKRLAMAVVSDEGREPGWKD